MKKKMKKNATNKKCDANLIFFLIIIFFFSSFSNGLHGGIVVVVGVGIGIGVVIAVGGIGKTGWLSFLQGQQFAFSFQFPIHFGRTEKFRQNVHTQTLIIKNMLMNPKKMIKSNVMNKFQISNKISREREKDQVI